MQNQRGFFSTLEVWDWAGKSTHVLWLADVLRALGLSVLSTREPGETDLGEHLRQMVLNRPMSLETETLLMFAARCEHVHTVIEPALVQGQWEIGRAHV